MDSFSKRRPPKFTEPIDFNKININYLFEPIGTNNHGGLYSSNLAHAINGINVNPFSTKGLNNYGYHGNHQWIAPQSCPPIGNQRDPFNCFSIDPLNSQYDLNLSTVNNTNNNNTSNNVSTTTSNFSKNNVNHHNHNNNNNNNINALNHLNNNLNCQSNSVHHNLSSLANVSRDNTNSSLTIGINHPTSFTPNNNNNNSNNNTNSHNSNTNNSLIAANSLNGLAASYMPPRVRRRNPTCTECVFCKNNGHPPSFYKSHILKDPEGKITCPILRDYDCPICRNGGGDRAHTVRYCPWNKPSFWQRANSRL